MLVRALAMSSAMSIGTFPTMDLRKSLVRAPSVITVMASLSSNPTTLWDSSVKRARYCLKVSSLSCRMDKRYVFDFFCATRVANRARNASQRARNDWMLPGLRLRNHLNPDPVRVRLNAWHKVASDCPCMDIHVS